MRPLAFLCLLTCSVFAAERVPLRDAVAQALSNNAALLASKADISVAEARILTARLRPNPAVSVSASHLDLLGTHFNDTNGGGPSEFTFGFEYTLVRGAKRPRRIEVAQETRAVTELQFRNASRTLVLQVEEAFVDALLAGETLKVARENQEYFRQIVEINETRVKTGDVAEVELIRTRLAALQYQTVVRQAEQKRRESLAKVQTLMGRPRPVPDFDIDGVLDRPDTAPLLEDLQKEALESRRDLAALQRDVRRAGAELALQKASAKQDWTVGTEYARQQVNARASALSLTLNAPLPMFDRNQGEIVRAEQERRQAELRVRALESEIGGDVDSAWSQFMTARSLLQTIRGDMLSHAREVREVTDFSYRRGDASLLSLLDAQRAFNETMQAYAEARAEYARSLYLLDNVTGKDSLP